MKLLVKMKIHDIIFIIHLKPIIDFIKDLYRRRYLLIFIVVIDGEKKYKIEKLLRKRIIKRKRK